ncbi:MAG: restriction endonuclease subunit S [Lunatimonas sp.]|uniref:restriction endonuclease subunit S n=1 Tax=Lunatimonas sp. TaxID=2060141 RepID=UPI00263A4F3F|nr:restriction endonuclease subunit S [Lunatimonas sp.]MCC5937395.1 restriction endonuclease subunit S [Lunatimonas sp.]
MKEGWKEYRLYDLAKVTMGLSPKGDSYNNSNIGIGLLNGPTEFGDTFPDCTLYTTDPKRICKKGDLIFCVRGSTTGRMNWADKPYALGRGVCSIRGKDDLTTKFLKHLLTNNLPALLQITGGGTFPNLRKEDINGFKFEAPSSYKKIAAILSAYDDLIENNLRRIKLLEEKAQITYEEWFVRMKFPGHESTPINEETGLPEGWRNLTLGDFLTLNYGKALKAGERIPGPFKVYGSSGEVGTHNKALIEGPGVIVGRKGNVGSVFWEPKDFYPIDTVYYVSSDVSLYFCYYNLKGQRFINNDAAVPGLNRSSAYLHKSFLPSKSILEKFDLVVEDLFDLSENYKKQNQLLKEARDILLPRLMTGMIDVDQLDLSAFENGDGDKMLMAAEPEGSYSIKKKNDEVINQN